MSSNENNFQFANYQPHMSQFPQPYPKYYNYGYFPLPYDYVSSVRSSSPHSQASHTGVRTGNLSSDSASGTEVSTMDISMCDMESDENSECSDNDESETLHV